jgi:serine/threonine-protein kinase
MAPRRPCPDPARWADLLDGRLPADEQARLAGHLDACADCQQTVEGLTADTAAWAGLAADAERHGPALGRAMDELKSAGVVEGPAPAAEVPLDFLGPPGRPGRLGRLGRYEVVEVVGRGGMGVVLKALDPALNRFVAIKVLAPQWAGSGAARERFAREARAAAAVRHENVVAIHGVDEVRGLPYLVMEYVHGTSLQQRLDRTGPLAVKEVLRIGTQAAAGLAAAHAQGIVHRDVKPANILLENGVERVKLTDFGLARAADDASLTQSGVIAGTPLYMAPEQARGEPVDPRADLFSLGSVLYLLCTGRPAFRAGGTLAVLKRVCEDAPRPIREVNPDVPAWLAEIVAVLHAKGPADRFQSAEELRQLLADHLAHLQHPGRVPAPPGRRRPARRAGRRRAVALVALGVLLVAGLVVAAVAGPAVLAWRAWRQPRPNVNAPWAPQPPRAVLANPRLARDPDGTLNFSVDYQLEPGTPDATLKYVWVVRAGNWKVHERTLQQREMEVQGLLAGSAKPPPVQGPLETYLECERLVPGKLGFQRERISDVLTLPP